MSPAKVVCAASVAALVIAPALVWRHVYPLPGFLEEALAVGLGLVLAACVLLLVPRGATRIPTLTFPIVALAGLISIQLALGRYEHASVPHLALAESLWLIAVIWAGRS